MLATFMGDVWRGDSRGLGWRGGEIDDDERLRLEKWRSWKGKTVKEMRREEKKRGRLFAAREEGGGRREEGEGGGGLIAFACLWFGLVWFGLVWFVDVCGLGCLANVHELVPTRLWADVSVNGPHYVLTATCKLQPPAPAPYCTRTVHHE